MNEFILLKKAEQGEAAHTLHLSSPRKSSLVKDLGCKMKDLKVNNCPSLYSGILIPGCSSGTVNTAGVCMRGKRMHLRVTFVCLSLLPFNVFISVWVWTDLLEEMI